MGGNDSKPESKQNDNDPIDPMEYLEVKELSKWILQEFLNKNKSCKYPNSSQYQIIDVRDTDFNTFGFKIRNAANHPNLWQKENNKKIEEIIKLYSSKEIIIFHCMFSQSRGPISAKKYYNTIHTKNNQKVKILKNGFRGFWDEYNQSKHKDILFEKC